MAAQPGEPAPPVDGPSGAPPGQPPPTDPPPGEPPPPPPETPPPPPPSSPPPSTTPALVALPEPVPAAHAGYPLQLTARPLMLPVGGVEGGAELSWKRAGVSPNSRSYVAAEPRLRYSAPVVELEARGGIGLYQTELSSLPGVTMEIERLAWVAGMARARLDDDTAVGAELVATTPSAEYSTYLARVFAVTKKHLTPRTAVELEGHLGVFRVPLGMMAEAENTATGGGEVRAMAQVSDAFGVVGRGALSLQKLSYSPEGEYFLIGVFGVRGVAAVSPNLDLVAGIDVLQSGDYSITQMTVGFVARSVP